MKNLRACVCAARAPPDRLTSPREKPLGPTPNSMSRLLLRRGLSSLATRAVVGAGVAFAGVTYATSPLHAASNQAPSARSATSIPKWRRTEDGDKSLPTFTRAEVAKHSSPDTGVWVVFRGGVYDITEFIQNHPGGVDKIMTAAGQSVEPFWALYRQHVEASSGSGAGAPPVPKDHVAEILGPLQIGWLDPKELAAEAEAAKKRGAVDDPYANEPERHPALRMLSTTPCSAETPAQLLGDSYITPSALFYKRNHHPVPRIAEEAFTLEVCGPAGAAAAGDAPGAAAGDASSAPRSFTMAQLRAMPQAKVTATIQCGGNRRGELNTVRKTSGNAWGCGAISTAEWEGVWLRDVLRASGVATEAEVEGGAVAHVQFEGEDGTKASIPVDKALSPRGDVLLAHTMNGEALPPDHGFPLRVVVPGHVGVRNIKWLRRVIAAPEEADGVWQRGMAYKSFGPDVTSLDGIDVGSYAPIQEMPVTSAILSPLPGAAAAEPGETVEVKGFAWSGGGRGIVRVDVSADDGATWHTAKLREGAEQPAGRAWAWTFWEADVPVAQSARGSGTTLVCKAVDASHNTQPERPASVWNLRGLANNCWHRVPIKEVPQE